jgi:hypothetical protein
MKRIQVYAEMVLVTLFAGLVIFAAVKHDVHDEAYAAGTSSIGTTWEREISRQKLVPGGVSSQLAVPNGAIHAELRITGADACVRWDAQTAVDSGSGTTWGCFPWPDGHWRKEDNDHDKLANFRVICTGCTVWADYFGRR